MKSGLVIYVRHHLSLDKSMKILKPDPEMNRGEFFSNLPPEIVVDILSRIPIKTVFACKCVCKSWLGLLKTPQFIESHLSNSVPGILIHLYKPVESGSKRKVFKIVELEDSLEVERRELHHKIVLQLEIKKTFNRCFGSGTVNGLLLLLNTSAQPKEDYVCNPITREYIKLPQPDRIHQYPSILVYGFGVCRLSNQYKVVRILHNKERDPDTGSILSIPMFDPQVYTLGTLSWRSISTPPEMVLDYSYSHRGAFFNGNLHWLARDLTGSWWISCFDLETEAFTKFRAPTEARGGACMDFGVLRNRLCLCDNSSESGIVIYVLNDYGDGKKCWNTVLVKSKSPYFAGKEHDAVCALKAFADGNILMSSRDFGLSCYYRRTKTIASVNLFDGDVADYVEAMPYVPSFISLKDFETESSKLFEFECLMI